MIPFFLWLLNIFIFRCGTDYTMCVLHFKIYFLCWMLILSKRLLQALEFLLRKFVFGYVNTCRTLVGKLLACYPNEPYSAILFNFSFFKILVPILNTIITISITKRHTISQKNSLITNKSIQSPFPSNFHLIF